MSSVKHGYIGGLVQRFQGAKKGGREKDIWSWLKRRKKGFW